MSQVQDSSLQDSVIRELLAERQLGTIAQVIALMQSIDDTLKWRPCGIYWFNLLYLRVTEKIKEWSEQGKWEDPEWVERLDVAFAELYFDALEKWLTKPEKTPKAWVPLFSSRDNVAISRVQFALMGLNAHINGDLKEAILAACNGSAPRRNTPMKRDHDRINDVLFLVEISIMQSWLTGPLKKANRFFDPHGAKAVMEAIRAARELAWINAAALHGMRQQTLLQPAARFLTKLTDRGTWLLGRLMSLPRGLDVPPALRKAA